MNDEVLSIFSQFGIVPVIAIDDAKDALPLADALLAGGLPLIEITFRTAAAAEAIKTISQARPQMFVGAGTVVTPANLTAAKECGAKFAVAPGLNPEIVKGAQAIGLPFAPGIATPTELEQGLSLGCKLFKFFPAEAFGGVKTLSSIAAPYLHLGVRFVPTGGVTTDNLVSYLKNSSIAAVGGTWLAKKDDFQNGNWADVADRCRAAVLAAKAAR